MGTSYAPAPSPEALVRSVRIRGRRLDIVGAQRDSAAILDDTFFPDGVLDVVACDPTAGEAPALTLVEVVLDPAQVRDLIGAASRTGPPGTFEITRGDLKTRFEVGDETVFVLTEADSPAPAVLVRSGTTRTLIRTPGPAGARWLTRLVREIATRHAGATGALILHASAFTFEDRAFLVIGDSGAGKSTTAIALARLLDPAQWIGNDRIHVTDRDGALLVTACPLPLAVNKGSLDVMGIRDFPSWSLHAGHPPAGSDWDQLHGEDKMKLSNGEVERFLGVSVAAHGKLYGVVFPRIDPAGTFHVEDATDELAADIVGRNCFSRDDNLYSATDWIGANTPVLSGGLTLAGFLARTAKLPRLRCTLTGADDIARLGREISRRR